MNRNLFARLAEGFPADRSRVFLETPDGAELGFAELLDRAGRIATLLKAAGVGPGDRVAAQVGKSPEAIALYLACLQAGGAFVPLDPGFAPAEVARIVADAEPRVVVCDPDAENPLGPIAASARASLYTLAADGAGRLTAEAGALPSDRAVAARAGSDLAAILYVPCSAGKARGVMLSHDNLWSNVATLHWLWGFRPDDVLIHALPLHRTDGLFVALNLMLMNGGRVILLPRFEAEPVIELMPRATVLMGATGAYARLLASPRLTPQACAGIRLFVSGSAPLPASAHAEFEARTGHRLLERYGMTETGVIASNPLVGERRPGALGQALPGVSLRVADGDGGALAPGQTGVLEVKGPNVFAGYWRSQEMTARALRPDGWFVTGAVATIGADGNLAIVGRDEDGIVPGEPSVHPREVEATTTPGV